VENENDDNENRGDDDDDGHSQNEIVKENAILRTII